jgi:hypothetical protein
MGKGYQSTMCNILEDWNLQCAPGVQVLQDDVHVNAVGSSSSKYPMMEMRLGIKTDRKCHKLFHPELCLLEEFPGNSQNVVKKVCIHSTQATVISVSSTW